LLILSPKNRNTMKKTILMAMVILVTAVIDFYADWCGPCRRVAPIMEKLAEEYEGQLVVYKINVDQEKDLAEAFQVKSIPMVLFIPLEGKPMMQVGAMQEAEYKKVVEEQLIK